MFYNKLIEIFLYFYKKKQKKMLTFIQTYFKKSSLLCRHLKFQSSFFAHSLQKIPSSTSCISQAVGHTSTSEIKPPKPNFFVRPSLLRRMLKIASIKNSHQIISAQSLLANMSRFSSYTQKKKEITIPRATYLKQKGLDQVAPP